jgi:hypothetical protein
MVIEAVGGDDQVKTNYLLMTLSDTAKLGSSTCLKALFTIGTNYVTCSSVTPRARNAIPYFQDIEVINAFHDGVSDIKTV